MHVPHSYACDMNLRSCGGHLRWVLLYIVFMVVHRMHGLWRALAIGASLCGLYGCTQDERVEERTV